MLASVSLRATVNWAYLNIVLNRVISQVFPAESFITHPIDQVANPLVNFHISSTILDVWRKPGGDGCGVYLRSCPAHAKSITHVYD